MGTPVIISDGTPWTDVNNYSAGWAFGLSEDEKFVEAINSLIGFGEEKMSLFSSNARKYAETKLNIEQLREEYEIALMSVLHDS